MAKLTWHNSGDNRYETGVSDCALYVKSAAGVYGTGVAWNGITAITETPEGAEANALYADNIKYLNLISAEELNGTIEAYTYPNEWAVCDGEVAPAVGMYIGQQNRSAFGLVYKTKYSDENAAEYYKLHIIYNATASPSERAYETVNDSPEAITFSWEFSTTPVNCGDNYKPTALLVLDSRTINATKLAALEALLYGTAAANPQLPDPATVISMIAETTVGVTYDLAHCAAAAANPTVVVQPASGAGNTYEVSFAPITGYALPGTAPNQLVTGATLVDDSYTKNTTSGIVTFKFNTVTAAVTIKLEATAG